MVASVRQRLLNYARSNGRPFNEVLHYFCLERFLYRLGRSPVRDRLVLKGALMFTAWQAPVTRPTRDIDLLGQMDNTVEQVISAKGKLSLGKAAELAGSTWNISSERSLNEVSLAPRPNL
jgi:hypothetical protein